MFASCVNDLGQVTVENYADEKRNFVHGPAAMQTFLEDTNPIMRKCLFAVGPVEKAADYYQIAKDLKWARWHQGVDCKGDTDMGGYAYTDNTGKTRDYYRRDVHLQIYRCGQERYQALDAEVNKYCAEKSPRGGEGGAGTPYFDQKLRWRPTGENQGGSAGASAALAQVREREMATRGISSTVYVPQLLPEHSVDFPLFFENAAGDASTTYLNVKRVAGLGVDGRNRTTVGSVAAAGDGSYVPAELSAVEREIDEFHERARAAILREAEALGEGGSQNVAGEGGAGETSSSAAAAAGNVKDLKKPRFFLCIFVPVSFRKKSYEDTARAARDTWARNSSDVAVFFLKPPGSDHLGTDVPTITFPEDLETDYAHLPLRTYRMFEVLGRHPAYRDLCHWYMKADADSHVHTSALLERLSCFGDTRKSWYLGVPQRAGVWSSYCFLEAVRGVGGAGMEDVMLAGCLRKWGGVHVAQYGLDSEFATDTQRHTFFRSKHQPARKCRFVTHSVTARELFRVLKAHENASLVASRENFGTVWLWCSPTRARKIRGSVSLCRRGCPVILGNECPLVPMLCRGKLSSAWSLVNFWAIRHIFTRWITRWVFVTSNVHRMRYRGLCSVDRQELDRDALMNIDERDP
eukprot:g11222.t1